MLKAFLAIPSLPLLELLTLGSGEISAFLAVIVNRKEAFVGAPAPRAAEAEAGAGEGEEGIAFSAAAAAAAAASLSSRGPAETNGERRRRSTSDNAARGAIARWRRRDVRGNILAVSEVESGRFQLF